MLRVDGAFDVPLKSVRAFSRENEYDYIQEGGMNDYVYMRRKPISKPFTLQVERYVATDFNDPLSNGTELLLPLMLFVGKNTGSQSKGTDQWASYNRKSPYLKKQIKTPRITIGNPEKLLEKSLLIII
jgi:hypothetical protein